MACPITQGGHNKPNFNVTTCTGKHRYWIAFSRANEHSPTDSLKETKTTSRQTFKRKLSMENYLDEPKILA